MSTILLDSLNAWWPELILSGGALLVVLAGVWSPHLTGSAVGRPAQPALALACLTVLASGWALAHYPAAASSTPFFALISCDPVSLIFRWLALGTTAIV